MEQSNPVNTDSEGAIVSVHIKQVMLLIIVKKTPFTSKNTKEIKEDISIIKSNLSDLHKAVIAHLYNFFIS